MKISVLVLVLACAGVVRAQRGAPAKRPEATLADAAIAERLCQIAQNGLMTRQIVPATLRQAIAGLEAAAKLNPSEPRFPRLLTEAYLQLGSDEGRDGAIRSLKAYLQLVPGDLGAQCQLIDTNFTRYETSEERKKVLDGILAASTVSGEVKSHVAVLAAKLSEERAEGTAAKKYVEQALGLMPLNPEALRLKFQQVDRDGTPLERITVLLQMLRSNPAQAGAMMELGSELADAGFTDSSLNWYRNGFDLNGRLGVAPDLTQATAYTAELLIADQLSSAQSEAKKLLDKDPANVEAAILSLLVDKRGGNAEKIELSINATRAAMLARLGRISSSLRADPAAPATQPASAADVDMAGDVKKLVEGAMPDASTAYASALADLAWLEIYFNSKTADAQQYLTPLRQLVPADSGILARLEGWSFLVDGKSDEARVKLSAVAERDPLAALGMIRLDKDKPASATEAAARKLLTDHSSGTMGAMLIEALRNRFGMMPTDPDSAAIRAQLDAFPMEWLDVLDFSKAQRFYSLKADGLKINYEFGEPILARVTLTNTSKYDITIGAEGAIHPDLWFDVSIKPVGNQTLPGVALDRITQKLVLHPRESTEAVVRVDQGSLGNVLQGNPNLSLALFFSVLTNPVSQQGGITFGPGGYRAQFSHTLVRESTKLDPAVFKALFARLQDAPADTRIRTIELLGAYAMIFKAQPDQAMNARAPELIEVVRGRTNDSVPSVRAVATYVSAILSDAQVKEGLTRQMLSDPWYATRMLGLTALQQVMETDQVKELAQPLADSDPDDIVKQFAIATIAVANLAPPTTAPTTGPTTQDSAMPGMPRLIGGADVGTVGK